MTPPSHGADPWSRIVRLDGGERGDIGFEIAPDAAARAALARRLGILEVRKLRFAGRLRPEGRRDWRLEAALGATVTQACVVTLEPVRTRIDEAVGRRYLAQMPDLPAGDEIEMPDDAAEPLPAGLDLGAVMAEALALALPPWPRADGVELGEQVHAGDGVAPLRDADVKPLAALRALIDGKKEPD